MLSAAIRLEGALNFRDFGGYKTLDGSVVCRGKLFRSDSLSALTARDFERLAALDLRLVCDLRSLLELEHKPTQWPEGFRPEILHMDISADLRSGDGKIIDILRRDQTERGAVAMMLQSYRMIPRAAQRHLRDLFLRLASDNVLPLMIHCSAGKDRTGVLAALIQLVLEVSQEDVFADYLLTERYRDGETFEATVAEVIALSLGTTPPREVVKAVADVRESYLEAALLTIDEDYGSLENYLATAGIDPVLLAKVRERLLDGHPPGQSDQERDHA